MEKVDSTSSHSFAFVDATSGIVQLGTAQKEFLKTKDQLIIEVIREESMKAKPAYVTGKPMKMHLQEIQVHFNLHFEYPRSVFLNEMHQLLMQM